MYDDGSIWHGGETGRLTGIDRATFESIVERVGELAEEAERLRGVIEERHLAEAAGAAVDSWQSSAAFVYDVCRQALELEIGGLALHAGSARTLFEAAGYALELERGMQF